MAARVNPTRMELTRLNKRLKMAVRGHKLLKDKRDEMVRRFMLLVRRNRTVRTQVEEILEKNMVQFAVAGARMGEENVREALMYPAQSVELELGRQNIMSVDVPTIAFTGDISVSDLPYGFAFTSGALDKAVIDMAELLPNLLELAQIEKTCNMLADEIEKTRRRVNALEHVMIPEMTEQIRYIKMKLDENERGNITRLMKVKDMMMEQEQV
ncbi:MAG: V-type ATP synthase subunit D [Eubacteriaceae bacterium]|jgi:V/A-type H+-transporting ATPase subunit D|nr:V-type ATP synthase subunit D [Eubacteriaceae bacterium]